MPSPARKVPEIDLGGEPFMNQMTGIVNYPQKIGIQADVLSKSKLLFQLSAGPHVHALFYVEFRMGRQNDILNQSGELDAGNWISGIPLSITRVLATSRCCRTIWVRTILATTVISCFRCFSA